MKGHAAMGAPVISRWPAWAVFVLGLLALVRALERAGLGRAATGLTAALYCLEVKSVAFSVNGMETGFVLALLAGVLAAGRAVSLDPEALRKPRFEPEDPVL